MLIDVGLVRQKCLNLQYYAEQRKLKLIHEILLAKLNPSEDSEVAQVLERYKAQECLQKTGDCLLILEIHHQEFGSLLAIAKLLSLPVPVICIA
ncbi:hypothetical protein CEXT_736291 [Caerostris extrusa]|uniref:Uncharacterized protein n=1 Tax=Caerostris extrusa TaxID=172846 RepID=A0AAV4UJ20_CAEEX|nr:hypothetical protein CEXT_736291 [Caerostris extrusa]